MFKNVSSKWNAMHTSFFSTFINSLTHNLYIHLYDFNYSSSSMISEKMFCFSNARTFNQKWFHDLYLYQQSRKCVETLNEFKWFAEHITIFRIHNYYSHAFNTICKYIWKKLAHTHSSVHSTQYTHEIWIIFLRQTNFWQNKFTIALETVQYRNLALCPPFHIV